MSGINKIYFYVPLVILIHLVGLIGINSSFSTGFVQFTPFHLIILTFILFANTNVRIPSFQLYVGICLFGGWLIEAAGVHSQQIFGAYSYGDTLGLKLLEVPVIIGVNWFLLSYCFLCCTNIILDPIQRSLVVAMCMTLFDLIMEPAAIHLGYWTWHCPNIPVQNYIAWFLFSWLFAYVGLSLKVQYQNKLAAIVIGSLTLFFILLDILLFA